MVYRRAFSVVFHHAAPHQSTLSRQSRLLIRKQRYQLLTKRRLIMQLVQLMISSLVKSQIAQSEYPLIFRHYFSSMRLIIVICANLIHCLFIFIKLSKFNCGQIEVQLKKLAHQLKTKTAPLILKWVQMFKIRKYENFFDDFQNIENSDRIYKEDLQLRVWAIF